MLWTFQMCLHVVTTKRHIGIDDGRHNFAMVAIDKEIGRPPVVFTAVKYYLVLTLRFLTADILPKLTNQSDPRCWMQQTDEIRLSLVERVVVHLEQMPKENCKKLGPELGKLLLQSVNDTATCTVKLSQPHLLRARRLFYFGEQMASELKLVPASYGLKQNTLCNHHRPLQMFRSKCRTTVPPAPVL